VGVAVDYDGFRSVLVFDRDSYELLGKNERHDGRLVGGSAVMESGVVDSMTALPDHREPTVTK
jgi:hypothetical protein